MTYRKLWRGTKRHHLAPANTWEALCNVRSTVLLPLIGLPPLRDDSTLCEVCRARAEWLNRQPVQMELFQVKVGR